MLARFVASSTDYGWSFQAQVIAACAIVAGIYLWRFATVRSDAGPAAVPWWRAIVFCAGLLVLLAALVSPLDQLAERRLFAAHMVQHLLIIDVVAIALVLGLNRALMRPAVKRLQPTERSLGRLASPVTALAALVAILWTWHIPALYELTLRSPVAHSLEHVMFLSAGLAFWWFLIEPVPARHRLSAGGSVAYISAAKLLLGIVGVALAFSTTVWYETYEHAPRTFGLSPLDDQNIGGVLMMIEQSVVLLIFFAISFIRMLDHSERAEQRRERYGQVP